MMSVASMRSAGVMVAVAILTMGPALAASPEGIWEIEMKDSRYRVELCGPAGTDLCGTLIWLGNGADSPENLPYLNTLLIDHARPTGPGQWEGDLHIYGQSAAGTIAQVGDDQITLTGCAFGIICKSYQLYRYVD